MPETKRPELCGSGPWLKSRSLGRPSHADSLGMIILIG
jgi:hypothetical protein